LETRHDSDGARAFANRLTKNLKHLGRWLKRERIQCYRLYDADIPEYALAVDVYEGERRWIHVQEYEAPKSVDPAKADARFREAIAGTREVLQVPGDQVFIKVRRQQKGRAQYEKLAASGEFHIVVENDIRLLVNFRDYLDTGLFLDHRITRRMVGELAAGVDFLNLFCYTGSATVYAARGGARSTTSVDMSRTYLDWAGRNMALNGFTGAEHRRVQANCLEWLEQSVDRAGYGLIFLDPPSFSTSRRMRGTFDVQRDHVELLRKTARLLQTDGTLIFSNNRRRFRMDRDALEGLQIEDISRATLPRDFERNPRIHNAWRIRRIPEAFPLR
jgi:23S rRNA (guanine2445-N2)-methyltransferase / 23S rRNA (guanine2069-N7)-methyltransferase